MIDPVLRLRVGVGALTGGLLLGLFAGVATAATATVVAPVQAEPASADAVTEPASADVLWRGLPLPVSLVVGQERRIDFPEPMADLDVPQAVTAHSRLVLTPTGQLHWQAREPFPAARVLATSISGTLYQLDVHADGQGAPLPPLVIRDPVVAALTSAGAGGGATSVPGAVAPDWCRDGWRPRTTPTSCRSTPSGPAKSSPSPSPSTANRAP